MTEKTPLEHIIDVLTLRDAHEINGHTYISGDSMYFPTGRVYGGQVIAQSVMAASQTVEDRLPHSLHGYFISPGDIQQDVLFDVENLRDGRSFSSRRVNVTQEEGTILTSIASFQKPHQEGVDFADPMPEGVPSPENLRSSKELMAPFAKHSPFAHYYAHESPFDIRHVTTSVLLGRATRKDSTEETEDSPESGKQMVWMKADGYADVDQTMQRALLALGCDQIMLEPIVRRAGIDFTTPGLSYASLDHSMWWYRSVDINKWHLYVQETPTAAHGRGLSLAKVYDLEGNLVAQMAQEAMIRVPQF
ncbi:acyl-CoA thioesterase [Alloscardovia criceti]|uniref:acyl-CoA thioesterase n=1 Tax=Alloscardovia criceti TaxID=356828 RepID=UPI000374D0E7|nr:acyl-CoA thioesterase domain-containing protein [Alloscardovia criceti]